MMLPLQLARTVVDLRAHVSGWRTSGHTVALVPTMGALHDGHLELVRRARDEADRVVASIFVNPTQFGPREDFTCYPRDEAGDAAKLASAGCHLLFAPTVDEMYPPGHSTVVDVGPLGVPFEGEFRPGHFRGVATVVTKLFLQCLPDVACFGEKDYQQLAVIRRIVRDLGMPVRVVGVPTVREADGLAMSSRNRYLTPEQRAVAGRLNGVLRGCAEAVSRPGVDVASVLDHARLELLSAGFDAVDYLAAVDADTLEPLVQVDRPARILCTVRLGTTRLLDNVAAGTPV